MTFSRLDENRKPTEVRVDDRRIYVRFEGGLEISVPMTHSPLKLTDEGFEEVPNGHFPAELLEGKGAQRNGQIALSVAALRKHKANDPLPRAKSFDAINRWFTPELAELA